MEDFGQGSARFLDYPEKHPTKAPEPMCPACDRLARDMTDLDDYIESTRVTPAMRIAYVEQEEGTYNPLNGHFLCDRCYITLGQPSAPGGWRCP